MAGNEEKEETMSLVNEWGVPNTGRNVEVEDVVPRGNDWEVVSLTASAYAASPGPRGYESIHEDSDSLVSANNEAGTSQALFMSGHFVFPPNQHENLPVMPEKFETAKGAKEDDLVSETNLLTEGKHEGKIDEQWEVEGLNAKEEFPSIPLLEERGHMTLSYLGPEFDEPISRPGLNVDEKEQYLYGAAKFGIFHRETVIGSSAAFDEIVTDLVEASGNVIDPSHSRSQTPKSVKEDEDNDFEVPCGAWWKRGVASLCAQAKETSAFWSILVAAAVMGLVVLGQRWKLSVADEKSGRILSHVKDVIVVGSRRGTSITTASTER